MASYTLIRTTKQFDLQSVLLQLRFCPLALKLDFKASLIGRDTLFGKFLHGGAWLISCFLGQRLVELSFTNDYRPNLSAWILAVDTVDRHYTLLEGNNVETTVPIALLLTWAFAVNRRNLGLLDVYNSIKYVSPDSHLGIEELAQLPVAAALYIKQAYIPPADLMAVTRSVVRTI
jgi:hypothetical protein